MNGHWMQLKMLGQDTGVTTVSQASSVAPAGVPGTGVHTRARGAPEGL